MKTVGEVKGFPKIKKRFQGNVRRLIERQILFINEMNKKITKILPDATKMHEKVTKSLWQMKHKKE